MCPLEIEFGRASYIWGKNCDDSGELFVSLGANFLAPFPPFTAKYPARAPELCWLTQGRTPEGLQFKCVLKIGERLALWPA